MKRIVTYEIEETVANSVRRVLANISDANMKSECGLTDKEILDIHIYLDKVGFGDD